jgi:hypothetical protein
MFSMFCLFVFVFAWPTWVYYYANKEYINVLHQAFDYTTIPAILLNDFNDLETFRASDKRTSSDFNKYLKYTWIYFKLLQVIMDIVPAPLKQQYMYFNKLQLLWED